MPKRLLQKNYVLRTKKKKICTVLVGIGGKEVGAYEEDWGKLQWTYVDTLAVSLCRYKRTSQH